MHGQAVARDFGFDDAQRDTKLGGQVRGVCETGQCACHRAQSFSLFHSNSHDHEYPQIPLAFFVVGGVVSMVVGPLADVMNRKHLYIATCLVGTIPCLLTYWSVCACLEGQRTSATTTCSAHIVPANETIGSRPSNSFSSCAPLRALPWAGPSL